MIKKPYLKGIFFKNVLLFVLFLSACTQVKDKKIEDYTKIADYLAKYDTKISDYKTILVLSDEGCISCNIQFSRLIKPYRDREDVKLIVTSDGNLVDISPFLNKKNIILDFERNFIKLGLTRKSSAIFLDTQKIDSVLEIEARTLEENFDFIKSKLK